MAKEDDITLNDDITIDLKDIGEIGLIIQVTENGILFVGNKKVRIVMTSHQRSALQEVLNNKVALDEGLAQIVIQ